MNFQIFCTVLYLLYCTVLYCTVLYCTVLYWTELYCTSSNSMYCCSKFVWSAGSVSTFLCCRARRTEPVCPSPRGTVKGGQGSEGSESGLLQSNEYETRRKLYVSPWTRLSTRHTPSVRLSFTTFHWPTDTSHHSILVTVYILFN